MGHVNSMYTIFTTTTTTTTTTTEQYSPSRPYATVYDRIQNFGLDEAAAMLSGKHGRQARRTQAGTRERQAYRAPTKQRNVKPHQLYSFGIRSSQALAKRTAEKEVRRRRSYRVANKHTSQPALEVDLETLVEGTGHLGAIELKEGRIRRSLRAAAAATSQYSSDRRLFGCFEQFNHQPVWFVF